MIHLFFKQRNLLYKAIRISLIIFGICSLITTLFLSSHKYQTRIVQSEELFASITNDLLHYEQIIQLTLRHLEYEIVQFSLSPLLLQFLKTQATPDSLLYNALTNKIYNILTHNPSYKNLTLLDNEANELLHVDKSDIDALYLPQKNKNWKSIPDHWLSIKKKNIPEYTAFSHSFSYEENSLDDSEIDKLSFHLFIRLKDDSCTSFFIVLTLQASALFSELPGKYQNIWHTTVLDQNGFYLYGSDMRRTLGQFHNHRDKHNIITDHFGLSRQIQKKKSGTIKDDKNIYIFQNIIAPYHTKSTTFQPLYTVLVTINQEDFLTQRLNNHSKFIIWYILPIFLLLITSAAVGIIWFFFHIMKRNQTLSPAIIDNIIPILIHNRKGELIYANKTFSNLTGFSLQEVITDETILQIIASKKPYTKTSLHRTKNGKKLSFHVQTQPIGKKDRTPLGYISTCIDISKQRKLEKELKTLELSHADTDIENEQYFCNKLTYQSKMVKRYTEHHYCSLAIVQFENLQENIKNIVQQEVFEQIEQFFRATDYKALLDNTMFAVLMPLTKKSEAVTLLKQFIRIIHKNFPKYTVTIVVTSLNGINNDKLTYTNAIDAVQQNMSSDKSIVVLGNQ